MEPRPARRAAGPRDRVGQPSTEAASRQPAAGMPIPRSIPAPPGPRAATAGPGIYPPPAGAPEYGADPAHGEPGQAMLLLPREVRHRRRVMRTVGTIALVLLLVGGGGALLLRNRLFGAGSDDPRIAGVSGTPTFVATAPAAATSPPAPSATRAGSGRSVLDTTPTPITAPQPGAATDGEEAPAEPDDSAEPPPAEGEEEEPPPVGERDLAEFLPLESEVPDGLVASPMETRTRDEVAAALETDDASIKLSEWGWDGNVFQEFTLPSDATALSGSTTFVSVSVHRFATPEAASEAFVYFSGVLMDTGSYEEFDVEPIGDEIRLLKGSPQGALLVYVYVQDGELLYRISGSATDDGDPEDDIKAVAQTLVER